MVQSEANIPGLDPSAIPDWWNEYEAAEELNCSPWELMDQPVAYRTWALIRKSAKAEIQKRQERLASSKNKQKGGKPRGRRGR